MRIHGLGAWLTAICLVASVAGCSQVQGQCWVRGLDLPTNSQTVIRTTVTGTPWRPGSANVKRTLMVYFNNPDGPDKVFLSIENDLTPQVFKNILPDIHAGLLKDRRGEEQYPQVMFPRIYTKAGSPFAVLVFDLKTIREQHDEWNRRMQLPYITLPNAQAAYKLLVLELKDPKQPLTWDCDALITEGDH